MGRKGVWVKAGQRGIQAWQLNEQFRSLVWVQESYNLSWVGSTGLPAETFGQSPGVFTKLTSTPDTPRTLHALPMLPCKPGFVYPEMVLKT